MTDLQAAIGLVELDRYESETLPRRKTLFENYNRLLSPHSWAICPPASLHGYESSYHLYMLRLKGLTEDQRDEVIHQLGLKQIASNVHFQPIPLLSYYKNKGYRISDYPVAHSFYQNEITLPLFYDLSLDDQEYLVGELVKIVKSLS
jgi:dTDP-4-amino-4,6-dideoxygalactose transaminase